MKNSFFKKSLMMLVFVFVIFTVSAMADAKMMYLGSYNTGTDGSGEKSSAEIAKYNPLNKKLYVIVGAEDSLVMADLSKLNHKPGNEIETYKTIELAGIVDGFEIGDITSVSVCKSGNRVAVAAQAAEFDKPGRAILLDSEGMFLKAYKTGIQPDMITFTPDGKYLLTADEGEPQDGYAEGTVDPKGSLTIINTQTDAVTVVDFSQFDAIRNEIVVEGLLLKKDTMPSVDLEPEYLGVSEDSVYVYVSMQEANAVAKVEIATGTVEWLKGLGFKDHSQYRNALDLNKNDKMAVIKTEDVKVLKINDKIYAFIGLERIGGVMMYDISDIENVKFVDYVNTRDFSEKVAGDVAPEGIDVVSSENSPTGFPLVFVANEVSGTVSIFQIVE